ncbi:uncharacterized protein V6R79_002225 [Siganus canaliculatus]
MLDDGLYTKQFFGKDGRPCRTPWRMNARSEYKQVTGLKALMTCGLGGTFEDIEKNFSKSKTGTECEDSRPFMSLLKRMLHVDPEERISPREAVGHHFIILNHFPGDTGNDMYVKEVRMTTAIENNV